MVDEARRQLLEQQVAGFRHAERRVGFLRGGIIAFDVEAEPADRGFLFGEFLDARVQFPVQPLATVLGAHVNALDPPEHAVTPVAPLGSDHQ